jgi:hypothetical protein
VTFRQLRRLRLDADGIVAENFLNGTELPSIETIELHLLASATQVHTAVEAGETSVDTSLALAAVRPLKAVGILRLSSLKFSLPAFPSSLAVLSRIQKTVTDLKLLVLSENLTDEFSLPGRDRCTMQLEDTLRHLRPKGLHLEFYSYQAIIDIMVFMDLCHTGSLMIRCYSSPINKPNLEGFWERARTLLLTTRTQESVIPMDHLQSLDMEADDWKLPEYELLLSLLHAPTLKNVSLATARHLDNPDFGRSDAIFDASWHANLKQPHSFPLVNSLKFALQVPPTLVLAICSSLHRIMGWFPNVQALDLQLNGTYNLQGSPIYSRAMHHHDSMVYTPDSGVVPGYLAVQHMISWLFTFLAPSEGHTPLVNLHSLKFHMELYVVPLNVRGSVDQDFTDASSECVARMCRTEIIRLFDNRAKMDAVELVLDSPVNVGELFSNNMLNLNFRAVARQSGMVD